ncbi:molybdopterin-dependent oxidoreductase [Streptomyces sp. H39-C1]|uniref:molybdopterin-dependent oxidoreductase n=1 Tax=Streptomyces sp. H39-C1 TaxID=3004355 RepID=UPI003FA6827B
MIGRPTADLSAICKASCEYSANLRLADFTSDRTILVTHRNGESLTAEHGFPLRPVVPHRDRRCSHQEHEGDGPPL